MPGHSGSRIPVNKIYSRAQCYKARFERSATRAFNNTINPGLPELMITVMRKTKADKQ